MGTRSCKLSARGAGTLYPFRSARRLRLAASVVAAALWTISLAGPAAAQSAPGGILETADSTAVRPRVSVSLPTRGAFAFPAPYGTTGVRITNASDCGGSDCVVYTGYSYWRRMNNHVGSNTMLIFMTLDPSKGGSGPTLYSYDKTTDQVTMVGPLFSPSSSFYGATGENWYFSASQPTKLYVDDGARLYRYDVLAKTFQTVFDITAQFGSNRYIWQYHSSEDDTVHSATLRDSSTYAMLGCLVYHETTGQFSYYPAQGEFDECQVDKSGQWLLIKEHVQTTTGDDDNVIVNLATGAQTIFYDQAGAGGHSDNGFGYMVAEDNWNALPGAIRLWSFGQPFPTSEPGTPPQGQLVYHTTDWNADIGHMSHTNAQAGLAPGQQYACGGNASRLNLPRNNEVLCFPLDGSLRVLVVAPVMTDLNASGGGTDDYSKMPKGDLDVTGQYFLWTSNMGGSRLDAFIVKVPSQLLTGAASSAPPAPPPTDTSAPPPIQSGSAQSVVWTDVVNATATGGSLQKTGGCDGCEDAGAVSQQQIASSNGYVEFTASETTLLRYVGLSGGSPGTSAEALSFAIRLQSGTAEVRENGVYRTDTPFVTGDVFRVAVESGAVRYYKNGGLLYASGSAPAYPLQAAAALLNLGSTVGNAVISGGAVSGSVAAPSVSLGVSVSSHTVTPGDTVQVNLTKANSGGSTSAELYFVILVPPALSSTYGCPDGDAVVFVADGFSKVLTPCVNTASPSSYEPFDPGASFPAGTMNTTPGFFTFTWPTGIPGGTYTFMIFTAPLGTYASGNLSPSLITAVGSDSLQASP
jgi:hypothetical protein